jgi:hypothetical protein
MQQSLNTHYNVISPQVHSPTSLPFNKEGPHSLYVADCLYCLNTFFNIAMSHTYCLDILSPSPNHQLLPLARFLPEEGPLSNQNYWMVKTKPQQALKHNNKFFLTYYGMVQLHYVGITQDKGFGGVLWDP